MFLHQNFEHYLFANLLYLLFFGSVLERMYGALTVGFTCLIGHVGGTMMLFVIDGKNRSIGASAGVTGLHGFSMQRCGYNGV